jgi:hypothetical protein
VRAKVLQINADNEWLEKGFEENFEEELAGGLFRVRMGKRENRRAVNERRADRFFWEFRWPPPPKGLAPAFQGGNSKRDGLMKASARTALGDPTNTLCALATSCRSIAAGRCTNGDAAGVASGSPLRASLDDWYFGCDIQGFHRAHCSLSHASGSCFQIRRKSKLKRDPGGEAWKAELCTWTLLRAGASSVPLQCIPLCSLDETGKKRALVALVYWLEWQTSTWRTRQKQNSITRFTNEHHRQPP